MDDMVIPAKKKELVDAAQAELERVVEQYQEGLITDGERYNKVVDIWAGVADRVAEEMMGGIGKEGIADPRDRREVRGLELQPDLHHGRLRCPWLAAADAPARRHAWSDGQVRPARSSRRRSPRTSAKVSRVLAVLHLDARRS